MNRKLLFLISTLVVLSIVACDRAEHDLAQKSSRPDAPAYTVNANVSMIPGPAHLKEIGPQPVNTGPDGAALFVKNCSACHQATGQGIPGAFPPLDGSPYVTSDKTDRMASIMIYGLMGPIAVKGTQYTNVMAPLGSLSDEDLAAIASYVRSAWSNKAPAVSPSVFADARKKWGTRAFFNISELGEEK